MKKPILSISILCSGREETKRCLDSLKTLRERVPSELILVDTGCDEKMKELLREYADRIIAFTWCNDFSKARNAGVKAARGYWFLYLDDDEWFLDTKAIEEFFVSGEYRDYGSANYYVRSYTDYDGKAYKETCVTRMTFLSQGVKFKGVVHETFSPLFSPIKLLPSVAGHFGYVFKTEEEHRKHSERNIMLLEKALPGERDNLRIWIHLVQEYLAQRNYPKLKAFCEEALKAFEEDNTPSANRDRGCFYCGLLEAEWYLSEYDQMKEDYERALSDRRNTDCCIAQLMTYGLDLAIIRREKEKESECCKRYLALWEKYKSKPEEIMLQDTTVVNLAFHPTNRNKMFCCCICLDLEKGDTVSLRQYFDQFGWEEKQALMTDEFIPCLVKAMSELPYEEIFTHAAGILANRPDMEKFWEAVETVEEKEGLRRLGRVFSGVEIPTFDRYRQIVDTYMWNASKKKIRNLQEILQEETRNGEEKENGVFSVHNDASSVCNGGPSAHNDASSARQRYFLLKLEEAAVIRIGWKEDGDRKASAGSQGRDAGMEADTDSHEQGKTGDIDEKSGSTQENGIDGLQKMLETYVKNCLEFYGEFFQERAFEDEMEFLPVGCRAVVKLRKMLEAQKEDNWEAFSAAMKETVAIAPEFGGTLKEYVRLYAERKAAKKGSSSQEAGDSADGKAETLKRSDGEVSAEMETLAARIKEQIPILIKQGMKEQALQVLRQLKTLMPEDEELKEWEKRFL